uniref:Betaine aldehyde dehydrogenase n=1 Tax=Echinococcus granulosus TaxID=6210 RepID=A0A068WG33_ECHGR|nr:betaine aldehyde dehydrogenase [Echinococcus granulosus]
MSVFISSPLTIPTISHSMKGLQDILSEHGYRVGSLFVPDKPCDESGEKVELQLSHLEQPVNICISPESSTVFRKPTKVSFEYGKVIEFLKHLSTNSSTDFDVLAQALVASLEVQVGDLMTYDKQTYVSLVSGALDTIERARLSNTGSCDSKLVSIYISPFDNDFLLAVTRILKTFTQGRGVVVYCASLRLMLPLFVFTKRAIAAGAPPHIIAFLPLNKVDKKDYYVSSIQMIMKPADLDSAARAIVKSSFYQAGTSSWRPSVVLVEQSCETDFHKKVKSLVSSATQATDTLNENSHLLNFCVIPSYLKNDLDEFLNLASNDGGEILRPSDTSGPIFIFALTPAAAVLDKAKRFPLGPFTFVMPFRTVKEGLKLAKYFSDREVRVLGAGEYASCTPKSATIWTENSSLSLQVLAKLSGYTTLGVNSDIHRLSASFYLSECSASIPSVHLPGLPVPVNEIFRNVNSNAAAELSKTIASTEKLFQVWKKIPFNRRLALFTPCEDLASIAPKLEQLNCDTVAQLAPDCTHLTLDDRLNCAFTNRRLCLLTKWQDPCGTVSIVLKSGELLPNLKELILTSIVLGNVVLLVVPKSTTASGEVHTFCGTINQLVTQCCPSLGSLGPIVQVKQVEVCPKGISSALSTLAVPGVFCISAPEEECLTAQVNVENLCHFTSVFWSLGGDLFAN